VGASLRPRWDSVEEIASQCRAVIRLRRHAEKPVKEAASVSVGIVAGLQPDTIVIVLFLARRRQKIDA
jgi:hypothetical protein